ncbi:MSHA biogenesis protein MshD [Tamilnaduibacter salinus]|uniref:MSHA biogenesis protein MshD n=1 Tax=Tamilnaduibacter salinus TaxID=1484056 RepID=A0A2A2I862_9GAMM|nr:prepilin-type N-terminal cleavage/methylation domain-containing protein [Tamilnaduibacter salinus]PAV27305.1 MSHA biogenesis protein MshD [Tamilnaduibacter salinus]
MNQRGVTLVELVMTIVIISLGVAGVVSAFALIGGRSADPLFQTRSVALSQLYMDEIMGQRYAEGTPVGGVPKANGCAINTEEGSREDYDDVDDYNAIDNQAPADAEGTALDGYDGFRVSIRVECAGGDVGLPGDDAKRIRLTVTAPADQRFVFSAYRANF